MTDEEPSPPARLTFGVAVSRPELKLYKLAEPSCADDGRKAGRAVLYRTLGGGSIDAPTVEELEALEKLSVKAEPAIGDVSSGLPEELNW